MANDRPGTNLIEEARKAAERAAAVRQAAKDAAAELYVPAPPVPGPAPVKR